MWCTVAVQGRRGSLPRCQPGADVVLLQAPTATTHSMQLAPRHSAPLPPTRSFLRWGAAFRNSKFVGLEGLGVHIHAQVVNSTPICGRPDTAALPTPDSCCAGRALPQERGGHPAAVPWCALLLAALEAPSTCQAVLRSVQVTNASCWPPANTQMFCRCSLAQPDRRAAGPRWRRPVQRLRLSGGVFTATTAVLLLQCALQPSSIASCNVQ